MDFQTHYAVLMPLVAGAYGLHFVRAAIYSRWIKLQALAQQASTRQQFLRALPDMHAISASVKAHLGWWTADALELCRRSMGGHAYSAYAGIASLMNDYGVITTGGGDNVVLAQQHVRFLLSSLRHQSVPEAASFVRDIGSNKAPATGAPLSAAQVIAAYSWLAAQLLGSAGSTLAAEVGKGKEAERAWNDNLLQLVAVSRVATYHYWLSAFLTGVEAVPDAGLRSVLMPLVTLLSLHSLVKESALFLEHRALQPDHMPVLRAKLVEVSKEVRQNAAGLVDAWDLPDHFVRSPLGARDGDIYVRYFAAVNAAPGAIERPQYWDTQVAPLTTAARL